MNCRDSQRFKEANSLLLFLLYHKKQKSQDFVRAIKNLCVMKPLSHELTSSRTYATHELTLLTLLTLLIE
jgi:hypothetical protein